MIHALATILASDNDRPMQAAALREITTHLTDAQRTTLYERLSVLVKPGDTHELRIAACRLAVGFMEAKHGWQVHRPEAG